MYIGRALRKRKESAIDNPISAAIAIPVAQWFRASPRRSPASLNQLRHGCVTSQVLKLKKVSGPAREIQFL
jgi:hypothetical protein